MAEIVEYLVLEDRFSQMFDRFIAQTSLSADRAQRTQESISKMCDIYEATGQSVNTASDAIESFSVSSDSAARTVESSTSAMAESFASANQSITEATESIQENAEAVDQWSESMELADEASQKTGKNLEQFGLMAGRTLGEITGVPSVLNKVIGLLGAMPRTLSATTAGLGATTAGLGAATAGATGLTAALGPLSIALSIGVGVVSGIIQMVDYYAGAAQRRIDELTEKMTEAAEASEALASEIAAKDSQLQSNNDLISQLNELGADNSFIMRLEEENKALERQIALNKILDYKDATKASEIAYDLANESYKTGAKLATNVANPTSLSAAITDEYGSLAEALGRMESLYSQGILSQENQDLWDGYIKQAEDLSGRLFDAIPDHSALKSELMQYVGTYDEMMGKLINTDALIDPVTAANAEIKRLTEAAAESRKQFDRNAAALSKYNNSLIDVSKETDNLTSAHNALESAMQSLNAGEDISVQTYYELMSLSPQYMQLLMAESGGILGLDEATRMLTQTKINEMGISKARELLDLASAYQKEQGSLSGYASSIDTATNSMWGLVNAQLAYMQNLEAERIMTSRNWTSSMMPVAMQEASGIMRGVTGQIDQIEKWTGSAKVSAMANPGQNMKIGSIGKVGEVGKINKEVKLADEDLKMLVDMAERKYVAKVNVQTLSPEISVSVTNANGEPISERDIANAIKNMLDEQIAAHTDTTYG